MTDQAILTRDRYETLVRSFFQGLTDGVFPEGLFVSDPSFWTTASGAMEADRYLAVPPMLAAIFPEGLAFEIDDLVIEGESAAAQVRSRGVFDQSRVYTNTYAFFFGFREGRIAAVAEHFNPLRVSAELAARMQERLGP